MSTKPKQEWSEGRVFSCLSKVFPSPAFVLLGGVRNTTGFARQVRTADALALSTWPSRGLYFVGVEIKVSKSDWRKELASPDKADAIQRYCRQWYIAAPAGIVPVGELPENWGLIECSAGSATIVRPSPSIDPIPPDIGFVCSVLRHVGENTVPRSSIRASMDEAYMRGKSEEAANKKHEADWKNRSADARLESLESLVKQFQQQSGINIYDRWNYGKVGRIAQLLKEKDGDGNAAIQLAKNLQRDCQRLMQMAEHAIAEMTEPQAETVAVCGDEEED